MDALVDRKLLNEMYSMATSEKHSFWYINLLNERDSMFYKNPNKGLQYLHKVKCALNVDNVADPALFTQSCIMAVSLAVMPTLSCDTLDRFSKWGPWQRRQH